MTAVSRTEVDTSGLGVQVLVTSAFLALSVIGSGSSNSNAKSMCKMLERSTHVTSAIVPT